MLLIPETCKESLVILSCSHYESVKVIKELALEHMLKRSTRGWYFL